MGWEIALAAASLAVSTAGAAASYQGTRSQASAGRAAASMRGEQARIEAQTMALRAREEETERQRRARLLDDEALASSAAMGIDPFASPTVAMLRGESERLAEADISSIRILGSARQRGLLLQGRGAELEGSVYGNLGRSAWVQPTVRLLGAGLDAFRAGGDAMLRPTPTPAATGPNARGGNTAPGLQYP